MKHKILVLSAMMALTTGLRAQEVVIDAKNFPDEVFRKCVKNFFDTDGNGTLSTTEIANAKSLSYVGGGIKSLRGIEYLSALEKLTCNDNDIQSLDLSSNKALKSLYCYRNKMTSLLLCDEAVYEELIFSSNSLRGDAVDRLIESMPQNTNNIALPFMYSNYSLEYNMLTPAQKQRFEEKGWKPYDDVGPKNYNCEVVEVSLQNFPDDVFRCFVSRNYDTDHDGLLSYAEVDAVKHITLTNAGVKSLKGIEFFKSVEQLQCQYDKLTELDVSANTKLKLLYCFDNQLTQLKLPSTSTLESLYVKGNQLTWLDVTGYPNLVFLDFNDNQLTEIDLSANKKLRTLRCSGNQLTRLDVTGLSQLTTIQCYGNQLTSLPMLNFIKTLPTVSSGKLVLRNSGDADASRLAVNVATMKGWRVTDAAGNDYAGVEVPQVPITHYYFPDEELRNYLSWSYDTDHNGMLSEDERSTIYGLHFDGAQPETLRGIEYLGQLQVLSCPNAKLKDLDLSGNPLLVQLDVSGNQLTWLDVSPCKMLRNLNCSNNQLTSLDLSQNPELTDLDAKRNQIETIDLNANTKLGRVNLSQNKLLAANLLKCTEIFALHIYGNPMAGSYVDKFCDLLPKVDFSATLDALHEGFDGVRLSSAHVSRLAMKGWNVMQRADSEIQYYDGEPGVTPSTSGKKGDVNHDTEIGIGDIVAITNIMAGTGTAAPTAYTACPDDHHPHLIDLGLPSGRKWACCNVGATAPEESGGYFAWGETEPKNVFTWDNYAYGTYDYRNAKDDYSQLVNIGVGISGTCYDAATVNWGPAWRMPTSEEAYELASLQHEEATVNGVKGMKFTGANGASIFIPAADEWYDSHTPILDGSLGEIQTADNDYCFTDLSRCASLYFRGSYVGLNNPYRYKGFPVRAVGAK